MAGKGELLLRAIIAIGAIPVLLPRPAIITVQNLIGSPVIISPPILQHGNGQVAMVQITIPYNGVIPAANGMNLRADHFMAHG
jgi:hypothetical protein